MADVPHMGLTAVDKALSTPKATTIAEQMEALIEQLASADAHAKRILHEIELIKRAIGTTVGS